MQWDAAPGLGFSTGEPWLPLGDARITVAAQTADPASMLSLHRRLIWLRKRSAALRMGSYRALDGTPPTVYAYLREHGTDRLLIALNFAATPCDLAVPPGGMLMMSTCAAASHPEAERGTHALAAHEGVLLRLP